MINTYKYIKTAHTKLHEFVMAFFDTIEFETGDYSEALFEKEFYTNLVSRHPAILEERFKQIYDITKTWMQAERTTLCNALRESNQIKNICEGKTKPTKSSAIHADVRGLLYNLFISLYEDVIKGKVFIATYGSLKDHYQTCKKDAVNDFEFCPACGIVEMQTSDDEIKGQHDHYLPKNIYPFSSVNFENLIPICVNCNSILVKSNKDILSYTGVVFFPFDDKHKGIDITVQIIKNDPDELSKIEWDIQYSNKDSKDNEVTAWKQIYKIESRHQTHVTGNIDKWYKRYSKEISNLSIIAKIPDYKDRKEVFLSQLENRKVLEHKTMAVLLDSFDKEARDEANKYSRF